MESQDDSLDSAKLREFKDFLLNLGDDFPIPEYATVAETTGTVASQDVVVANLGGSLHEVWIAGADAEGHVHPSVSGQSRWRSFRSTLARKKDPSARVVSNVVAGKQPAVPSPPSRGRDHHHHHHHHRQRGRLSMEKLIRSTPPQSGGDAPAADTQPYPEWVYDAFLADTVKSSQPRIEGACPASADSDARPMAAASQQDDENPLDRVQQSPVGQDKDDNDSHRSDMSVDHNADAFTSSPGIAEIYASTGLTRPAKTPTPRDGKQFGRNGDAVDATTPAVPVNPFARSETGTGEVMGLSQVFQATQAITPIRPNLMSDPLTDRPSPDMYNARRAPSLAFLSSPLQTGKSPSKRMRLSPLESPQKLGTSGPPQPSSSTGLRAEEDASEDDVGPVVGQAIRARIQGENGGEAVGKTLPEINVPQAVEHRPFHGIRDEVADSADSPTSSRQLQRSRSELDSGHIPATRAEAEGQQQVQVAAEPTQTASEQSITHPRRVLALFKGVKKAYYPATCLSSVGPHHCRVRFDDGNTDELESCHIRSLDLRQGDVVKVDLPGMRQKNFSIAAFQDPQPLGSTSSHREPVRQGTEQFPMTDIYGHTTVLLTPKGRGRLKATPSASNEVVSVPLTNLYILTWNWDHFKDRVHFHHPSLARIASGYQTPARESPDPLTPASRSRRVTSTTPGRRGSKASSLTSDRTISNLFRNMCFAVSYVESQDDKKLVMKQIVLNGGTLLEDGFTELFDVDLGTAVQPYTAADGSGNCHLKPHWERTGFVCVIADQHSRRAKYIQALALGLPCLSGRWIEDCIRDNAIINWEPYLLPAGQSEYLKAIRSRTLRSYPADQARFADILDSGPKLFQDKSILIVQTGEAANSRQAFLFLILALGATRVGRVADMDAAHAALAEAARGGTTSHPWDFLYTGAQSRDSGDDVGITSTTTVSLAGTKRKRSSINAKPRSSLSHETMTTMTARVIDNEWLVQSLILGKLMDA